MGVSSNRRRFELAGMLAALAFLVGCQSPNLKLDARSQREAKIALARLNPASSDLPGSTPIIDIHAHTFNARYLPLQGILLGKRDAFPPITTFISDSCASNIAEVLINAKALAPGPVQGGIERSTDLSAVEARRPGLFCRIFLHLIRKAQREGAWEGNDPMAQLEAVDRTANK